MEVLNFLWEIYRYANGVYADNPLAFASLGFVIGTVKTYINKKVK